MSIQAEQRYAFLEAVCSTLAAHISWTRRSADVSLMLCTALMLKPEAAMDAHSALTPSRAFLSLDEDAAAACAKAGSGTLWYQVQAVRP